LGLGCFSATKPLPTSIQRSDASRFTGVAKVQVVIVHLSNGARLLERHCAVDPNKIPYGSKVVLPDAECVAVDTGPDVVKRKAASLFGRNAAERNAIVIDRFFDAKEKALAWARANPHFMVVRVAPTPESRTKARTGKVI
jgi:3D (Asp-Asp-Asp) domain-containing protein